jgi:hypothetical protein
MGAVTASILWGRVRESKRTTNVMKGGSFDANWLYCEAIETADI